VQQEFTENLTGVKADDSRTFVVDYPADFTSPGLAGKKVEYTTEVTSVRQKELPDLDDEWVKSLGGDFDSVETFKAKVREDLEARAIAESDHNLRDALIRKLLDAHPLEVPQSLVEHQTQTRLEGVVRQMMSRGIDPRTQELNWESAREELKGQAEEDVRSSILLDKIADTENIDVTDEEIDAEIKSIASASRQTTEQVRAALTKDGGERSIAHRLRSRKALEFLIENANITDAEWTESKEPEEAPTDE
jgi:trigger factor